MSTFRRATTAAVVLCALAALALLAAATAAEAAPSWSDLPPSTLDVYGLTQDDIAQMSSGYPDGTWRPGREVTRGQFARLALGHFRIPPDSPVFVQQHFSDVPQASPYFGWVEAALEVGLISGYRVPSPGAQTLFGLYDYITREQAAIILARYLRNMDLLTYDYVAFTKERANEILAPFSDADQVTYKQEVALAIEVGVLRGSGTGLAPKAHLTRIQAAALIVRTQELLPSPTNEPPTANPHVLDWLSSDARLFGVNVEGMLLGRAAPWMPRALTMKVRLEAAQDPAAYQHTAELLAALAEQYEDQMKYEKLRVVMAIPGGAWVYDHVFREVPQITYPPVNSAPYHDFFYELSGDGYEASMMTVLREDATWIIRLVIRVEADGRDRETYDAICDYLTARARQYGVASGENERLRIVLVEATPIPPMGLPVEIILEQRDFDLGSGEE